MITAIIVDDAGIPISGAPSVNMGSFFTYLNSSNLTALYTLLGIPINPTVISQSP